MKLRTGASLRCSVDREIRISLDADVIRLPYPDAGIGGTELVVSPDELHALLYLYSGQSEMGWELFSLAPFRHLGGLPYVIGEGVAPAFSPDAAWLAMFGNDLTTIRGSHEHAEDVLDANDDQIVIVDWARLYLQALPDGPIASVPVGTPVPRSTSIDVVEEWNAHDGFAWNGTSLELRLPWGTLSVPLPVPAAITTSVPPDLTSPDDE